MDLDGKKVLIVKLRYIGDTLSIIPVVENLKEKVPDVILDVMVNKGTEEVLAYNPDIRKVWVYDRKLVKKNIFTSISYHNNFIKKLRVEQYDFIIDFTNGDRAAFLAFMTGAPLRITHENSSTLSHLLMNRFIRYDPFKYHIVDLQLQSLRFFGLDSFDSHLTLHIPEFISRNVDNILSDSGILSYPVKVVIHPGARGRLRQWRPERFAEIAFRLKEKYRAAIILVGGQGERDILEEVETHMGFPASFKSNTLSLLELGSLLERSQLFIGNDSAPGHMAAAVNCPNLTLFGPTYPHMWRPLSSVGKVVFKNVPCCGCRQETCIRPDKTCMDLIGVNEVWEKAERIMNNSKGFFHES